MTVEELIGRSLAVVAVCNVLSPLLCHSGQSCVSVSKYTQHDFLHADRTIHAALL